MAAGPQLRPPVMVAGRGLAALAHPAPLPAGPVHTRRQLPDGDSAFAGDSEVDTLLADPATYGSPALTRVAPSG